MPNKTQTKTVGMGFVGWLQLMFIGLKLTGYTQWSWWLVLSPFLTVFGFIGVLFLLAVLVTVFDKK